MGREAFFFFKKRRRLKSQQIASYEPTNAASGSIEGLNTEPTKKLEKAGGWGERQPAKHPLCRSWHSYPKLFRGHSLLQSPTLQWNRRLWLPGLCKEELLDSSQEEEVWSCSFDAIIPEAVTACSEETPPPRQEVNGLHKREFPVERRTGQHARLAGVGGIHSTPGHCCVCPHHHAPSLPVTHVILFIWSLATLCFSRLHRLKEA